MACNPFWIQLPIQDCKLVLFFVLGGGVLEYLAILGSLVDCGVYGETLWRDFIFSKWRCGHLGFQYSVYFNCR